MDVYQKVIARIYEISGGKETVDVDLAELLKREGFFPSIQNISEHLKGESWVTETAHQDVIRITHWGVAEAKRLVADLPNKRQLLERDANRLLTESREFVIMLEDFASDPSVEKFGTVRKRYADIGAIVGRLEENI